MPLHVSSICAHHQEVKIALHSLWYHHTYRWPSRAQVERGLVNYEDKYTEMHGQQNVKIIRSVQVFFCVIFRIYFCVLDVHLHRLFSLILSCPCHICNIFQCPFISFLSVPKVLFSSSFLFWNTTVDGETKYHIRTKQRMKLLLCTYISFVMILGARQGDKTFWTELWQGIPQDESALDSWGLKITVDQFLWNVTTRTVFRAASWTRM